MDATEVRVWADCKREFRLGEGGMSDFLYHEEHEDGLNQGVSPLSWIPGVICLLVGIWTRCAGPWTIL